MCDYKTVHKDDGTVTIEAADKLVAEMLIAAYVPEAGLMSFEDAYALALERDTEAATQLEADCNLADYEADDPAFTAMVNAAFARAEAEDLLEAEQEDRFIIKFLLNEPVTIEAVGA